MWRSVLIGAILAGVLAGCSWGGASEGGASGGSGPVLVDSNTSIDLSGAIGGVRAGDSRTSVERRLGPGTIVSTVKHHKKGVGDYTLSRIRYPASDLVVLYVAARQKPGQVFSVFTTSPRYHTADDLRVGSTLAQARHEQGISCSPQPGYVACQGGLGFEKPITSFTVKDGRVVRVFMAAVAD